MNWRLFNPNGTTGGDDEDMLFHMEVYGPDGAHYELLKEEHHTSEDVARAKQYIRRNYDCVSIKVIKETI